ncbi:MAG: wax ester/triacylglycerol synthase family O-acyltransferase [Terriglobia bacterium]
MAPPSPGDDKRAAVSQPAYPRDQRARSLSRGGTAAVPSRSLSAVDAAFLYLERSEIPLAIACVTIFDGPIPFDQFVAKVASKLAQVPRYQQVVVMPSLNMDLPTWEDDRHFDIHRHVFRVVLDPPGGEAQLEALAGRIFSQILDRNKPLWEIYVVDGLKDKRNALIWRLHHALADGISANRLLELFLDTTPEGSPAPTTPRLGRQVAADSTPKGGLAAAVHTAVDGLISTERSLLGFAQALVGDPKRNGSTNLFRLLPELLMSVERLPFNKPCGKRRKFCWAEFDMADVKAIREAVGGRVNDVILAVLTRALARYVKLHGQSTVNRFVRIVCPVNLRKPGQEESLGNQISFMPVALPMGVRDPVESLRAVAARTETMKSSGAATLLGLVAAGIAKAPPPLQALFWWGLPEVIFPVPILNMICTNVPGPSVPLYALGRRMIAAYPQVPTGYELGVNVAVASYDGKLFFGLIADAQVASDVNRLRDFLYVSFQELKRAARKLGTVRAPALPESPRQLKREVPKPRRLARPKPTKPTEPTPPEPEMGSTAPTTPAAVPAAEDTSAA